MIVVDASAVLAVLFEEPDAMALRRAMLAAQGGVMSAVNYWEVLVRARAGRGPDGRALAEALLAEMNIAVVAADADEARAAADAFQRFGKRSAAGLNLGDCFAYALAAREGEGLLFKGDDFTKTDVTSALA